MWSKVGMGGEHHRYYKHNKFHKNPRGDPKFLVDLTRNDPRTSSLVFKKETRPPVVVKNRKDYIREGMTKTYKKLDRDYTPDIVGHIRYTLQQNERGGCCRITWSDSACPELPNAE